MVLKPCRRCENKALRFENDVEMYGAQTTSQQMLESERFENDVEMYGAQTFTGCGQYEPMFENDVEMYGAQTSFRGTQNIRSLRMM